MQKKFHSIVKIVPFAALLLSIIVLSGCGSKALLSLDFEDVPNEGGGQAAGVTIVSGHDNLGILIDENDTLTYQTDGHINNKRGSIEFWFQPNWAGGDGLDHTFFDVGDEFYNRIRIQKDAANNLRFIVWGPDSEHDVSVQISDWQPGGWHLVRADWSGDTIALYVDGQLQEKESGVPMPARLASQLYIGSMSDGRNQANAVIDQFRIYSSAQ
jgi:hypothetical protein